MANPLGSYTAKFILLITVLCDNHTFCFSLFFSILKVSDAAFISTRTNTHKKKTQYIQILPLQLIRNITKYYHSFYCSIGSFSNFFLYCFTESFRHHWHWAMIITRARFRLGSLVLYFIFFNYQF